jgi:glucosamine-6-phosphate deaminase
MQTQAALESARALQSIIARRKSIRQEGAVEMDVRIVADKHEMGARAAAHGAALIRKALAERRTANVALATGTSQFEMLARLVMEPDIDWYRVTAFHLDEYVGLPISHPASFRRYLWERFYKLLPTPVRAFHFLNGEVDGEAECRRMGELILNHPLDVAFVGIGENGHLAFNDPPADFKADEPFQVVDLDDLCRMQQYKEGWFPNLECVPQQALTMTIPQILKSASIVCTVPDERKALAVRHALEGEISPQWPASILQSHKDVTVFLDPSAASLLKNGWRFVGPDTALRSSQPVSVE